MFLRHIVAKQRYVMTRRMAIETSLARGIVHPCGTNTANTGQEAIDVNMAKEPAPGDKISEYLGTIAVDIQREAALQFMVFQALKQLALRPEYNPQPGNPDPTITISPDAPSPTARISGRIRSSELRAAARPGGYTRSASQSWAVSMFTLWEETHRKRLAEIANVDVSAVTSPIFGDIRHLRNDVVHHLGVATKGNAGRCAILTDFEVGDQIEITFDHYERIASSINVTIQT